MNSNETFLRDALSAYGAEVESWPDSLKPLGRELRSAPAYLALFAQEAALDALLAGRPAPAAGADFASCVIASALQSARADDDDALPLTLPGLAYRFNRTAFAMLLALGFAIGYGVNLPAAQQSHETTPLQMLAYDEGSAL